MKKISIITLLGSLLFLMPCIVLAEVENIDVDKIMSLDPHPTIGQVDWACECNFIFKECGTSETRGDYGCTPSSMGTVNMTTYFTSDWDFITWKERIDEGYGRETVVDKQVYLKSDNPDPLERCKLLLISTTYDEALGRPSSRELPFKMSFVNSKIPAGIFSFVSEPKCKVYYPQVPICCCQNSDLEVDKKMTCQKATGSVLDPNACASGFSRMEMPKSNKCSDLEVEKFEPYDTKTNFSLTTSALVEKASKSLNPMGFKSVNALLGRIIYILMSIIGTIALVMYIYAGVLWMGAAGQADRITSAKNILVWTSLGVITSLSSYIIVKYIFDILSS